MNKVTKALLILEVLFFAFGPLFFDVSIVEGNPKTIVVTRDATSIQKAINLASVGDTVLVPAGVYYENVVVNKSIFLLGENRSTIIDGSTTNGNGITIQDGVNNVTVKGFTVKGASNPFAAGIRVDSNFNEISENNVTDNFRGIYMYDSSGNVLRANRLARNILNFGVWGLTLSHFTHDIDVSNTVDAKPIYYWVNEHDRTVPSDAGYVAAVNSFGIAVRDVELAHNLQGVLFAYTSHSRIESVTIRNNDWGVELMFSHENTILRNAVLESNYVGIYLHSSNNNEIEGNRVMNSGQSGIVIEGPNLIQVPSQNNTVRGNLVSNNSYIGVQIEGSTSTGIYRNRVTKNTIGIYLGTSNDSLILENRVFENEFGFRLMNSARNSIYHNNLVNNTVQADCSGLLTENNKWDNGYPFGGNYWNDYEERYPNATEIDDSGIWNTPYYIDSSNGDKFPLMMPENLNAAPIAEFSTSPSDPVVLHEVRFMSTSADVDGEVISFFWDFDDGSNSTEENPAHIYVAPGLYNVTLRVVDDESLVNTTYRIISLRKIRTFFTLTIPPDIETQRPVELVASLFDEYRDPLVGEQVQFYIVKDDGEELIGNATTDNNGVAKLTYSFSSAGSTQIQATFPGSPFHEASSEIEQISVRPTFGAFPVIAFLVLIIVGFTLFGIFNRRRKKPPLNQPTSL